MSGHFIIHGLREDGRHAAVGQALSEVRHFRHLEGPPALADGADAVSHLHRDDPEPL